MTGVPFLTPVFGAASRLSVEIAFGANLAADPATWTWTDVTGDVRYGDGKGVSISPIGRSDEFSTAQPAAASLQLANTNGEYSPFNPNSSHFPYVRRNTPIRTTVNLTGVGADTSIRFQGEVTSWTPSWDTSAHLAIVTITASGLTRRLQQGSSPQYSALYRAITRTAPVAYWPLEDGALVSAPTAAAGTPMIAAPATLGSHATTGLVSGGADGPIGGGRAADLSGGGQLTGIVTGTSGTSWRVAMAFRFAEPMVAGQDGDILTIRTVDAAGNAGWWRFSTSANPSTNWAWEFGIENVDTVFDGLSPGLDDGRWHWLDIAVQDGTGTNATYNLYLDGVLSSQGTNSGPIKAGKVLSVVVSDSGDIDAAAHVAVWATNGVLLEDLYGAFLGHTGETATQRLTRLCSENGIPLTIIGTSTTNMGPQGTDPLPTLLREPETADGGVLYDGRGPGLTYVTRTARYNQAPVLTADVSAGQVGDPFAPVDDDQRIRNRVKADRKGATTSTPPVEQTTGPLGTATVGVYDTQITLPVDSDDYLIQYAAWMVHLGTVEGLRYPQLRLDLAAVPALAAAWLTARPGSRVDVTNITSRATQHPPDDVPLVVEGWSEILSPLDWEATVNASPYRPWEVGVVEGTGAPTQPVQRVDSDASSLASSVTTTATSLSVAYTDGVGWTTTAAFPADFPFDVELDGERVRVTAITGSSSPQTFTVTRSVNGVVMAHPAGTVVKLWRPAVIAL